VQKLSPHAGGKFPRPLILGGAVASLHSKRHQNCDERSDGEHRNWLRSFRRHSRRGGGMRSVLLIVGHGCENCLASDIRKQGSRSSPSLYVKLLLRNDRIPRSDFCGSHRSPLQWASLPRSVDQLCLPPAHYDDSCPHWCR